MNGQKVVKVLAEAGKIRIVKTTTGVAVEAPRAFIDSPEYRETVNGLEHSILFQEALRRSSNMYAALAVTVQTAYAGWAGRMQLERSRSYPWPVNVREQEVAK